MTTLEAAIAALREAAWREGIRPEGPLGAFVQAQEQILTALFRHEEDHKVWIGVQL